VSDDTLTVQDILDEANETAYHTLLEVWRGVLKPAEAEAKKLVTPQWANRIVSSYNGISFADMNQFRDLYFDRVRDLAKILDIEIESDDECLNLTTPEEDVEHNAHHYKNVLLNWQKTFMLWELDWRCDDEMAAIDLATISEVHKMFFDQNGLIGLLDQIKFEFTDDDRMFLQQELGELTTTREE